MNSCSPRKAPIVQPLSIFICSRDRFPPDRSDVKVLFFKEMRSRGHRIDWLLLSDPPTPHGFEATLDGSRIWVAPAIAGKTILQRALNTIRQTAHELRLLTIGIRGNYDVIQVKDRFFAVIPGLIAAALSGAKFVFWLSYPYGTEDRATARKTNGLVSLCYSIRSLYTEAILQFLVIPWAAHVFVQSDRMRDLFIGRGCKPHKTTAVPMGIDREEIEEALNISVPINGECICYLGTLSQVRDPTFMVKVLAEVRKTFPHAFLLLVGRGEHPSDEQAILEVARHLGVEECVRITGQLPRSEAWQLVRAAAVCLSPFPPSDVLDVASPTKLVEYMALGKAVVANDIPEQRALIAASRGGICVGYSVKEFAEGVGHYLKQPREAAEAGCRGQRYVLTTRDYSHIAESVESAYQNLARKNAISS